MKAEKKKERLAELFGIEIPADPTPVHETASREAEATIAYYEAPHKFMERMCKYCERVFAVNRANVSFCGDACRIKHLADKGIAWDPNKTQEERWSNYEPLTVPPAALEIVKPLAEAAQLAQQHQEDLLAEQQENEVPSWESVLAELEAGT